MKYIYLSISILVIFFCIGNFVSCDLIHVRACSYEMPNRQYCLIKLENRKYAIKFMHIDEYEHWLFEPSIISNMGEKSEREEYSDSCIAKGVLKDFCDAHPKDCLPDSVLGDDTNYSGLQMTTGRGGYTVIIDSIPVAHLGGGLLWVDTAFASPDLKMSAGKKKSSGNKKRFKDYEKLLIRDPHPPQAFIYTDTNGTRQGRDIKLDPNDTSDNLNSLDLYPKGLTLYYETTHSRFISIYLSIPEIKYGKIFDSIYEGHVIIGGDTLPIHGDPYTILETLNEYPVIDIKSSIQSFKEMKAKNPKASAWFIYLEDTKLFSK